MMAVAEKQRRNFRAHSKLLMDVIKRQAGTLEKAILESLMNMVDAKATTGSLTIDRQKVVIQDNGVGMTRAEVLQNFETFGQPHEDAEAKVYGRFRMGRGQLFAFGQNVWTTRGNRMLVDIERDGLEYDLLVHEESKKSPGTLIEITLYEPLTLLQIADTCRNLKSVAKYLPIQVVLNNEVYIGQPAGRKLLYDPAKPSVAWTEETDDYYFYHDPRASGVAMYNLGAYMNTLPTARVGCSGVVVSKREFLVNFARNEVLSTCPLRKQLTSVFNRYQREGVSAANRRQRRMSDSELLAYWREVAIAVEAGELPELSDSSNVSQWWYARVWLLATGKLLSFNDIFVKLSDSGKCRWAAGGDSAARQADRVHQFGRDLVFSERMLEELGCYSVEKFIKLLCALGELYRGLSTHNRDAALARLLAKKVVCVSLEELLKDVPDRMEALPRNKYTALESLWLSVLSSTVRRAATVYQEAGSNDVQSVVQAARHRRMIIGDSVSADGWTDGESYVAISRQFIERIGVSIEAISDMVDLLIHEWCHGESDVTSHIHDEAFYELYHNVGGFRGVLQKAIMQAFLQKRHRSKLTTAALRRLTLQ